MNYNKLMTFAVAGAAAMTVWGAAIKGKVTDDSGTPFPGATLRLISMADTLQVGMTIANDNGEYSFDNVKPGAYSLMASMVGMDDAIKDVTVSDTTTTVNLSPITLTENSVMLDEAVVTAIKAAVVAKQDTIEFNADSFHTAPNATVNELLKKLPGVEVGADGSITANGKTISKILVNDKEFFSDDPQMASKNLLSEIIDKVQVVDRKSDLARLTGVDDGEEETVINLTVKKGMDNGWFGNVSGGYGTDKRYQGSFVVNNFTNGNQITLLGGLNNINESGFTDRGRGRFRDFGGSNGINTTQWFGVNFNVGKDDTFRVGGNIMYSHTSRNSTRRTATQYLYPDKVNWQDAFSENLDKGHNVNSDFRLQWKIDPANTIEFRPRLSLNFRDSEQNSLSTYTDGDDARTKINRQTSDQNNKGTSVETSGDLIYNHNFLSHPGRSFSVQGQYSFSNTHQKSTSWSEILYYLLQDDNEELYRFIDNRTWSNTVSGRITWTEPIGDPSRGNFITAAYRVKYQWNNSDRFTYNIPVPEETEGFVPPILTSAPSGSILSDDLSNSYRNKFFNQELQVGYKKVSRALNLEAGLLFAPASSKSEDLINSERNIPKRWVWNVSPYANIRYKFGTNSSLRANYRARTNLPSMTQLQPVADVSNPLNILIGNPDLKPTFTQSVGIFFNNYQISTQQSIMGMLNGSYALNTIVSRTITDKETGGRTTTYSNANGNLNLFGMAMINRPFVTNSHWRFNARMNVRFTSTPGYINGDFNRTANLNLTPSVGVTFSSDIFQMSVNPTYGYGSVTNTLPNQTGRQSHDYGFRSDASLYLPFGVDVSTDITFSKSTGMSAGYNSSQWLWNAQVSYSFLRDKSLTLSARAYDILGLKKNISRSISASSIIDSEYNDLTRYFMFSLTWNFNTMRSKKASHTGPDFDGPEGPGHPGAPDQPGAPRGDRPSRGDRGPGGFRHGTF